MGALVKQELLTLPEHLSSPSGVRVTRSLVLCVCLVDRCFFLLSFFFWPLCCLFFFDIQILITPLVSSNFSLHLINNLVISHLISDDKTIIKLLPLADDDENATTFINANYIPVSTCIKYNLYSIYI